MKKNLPAWMTLAAAIALIGVGLSQGQHTQVLSRAIRVCMECVGIG